MTHKKTISKHPSQNSVLKKKPKTNDLGSKSKSERTIKAPPKKGTINLTTVRKAVKFVSDARKKK